MTACLDDTVIPLNETIATPSQNSLYQVETCVRVTPRTGSVGQQVGRVVLSSSADILAVAVDSQLMLYSSRDHQLVSAALSFESAVDCVACSGDGSLLVVGQLVIFLLLLIRTETEIYRVFVNSK